MMEKQDTRDSLVECIEAELQKDADDIDGDCIDRHLDELYALDGLSPPRLSDKALEAAARTIRSRAAWRRRNELADRARKRRFARRALRGAWVACCASLALVAANFVTILATDSCLPSKVGIRLCCGTQFCVCETAKGDGETPGDHFP
jgi:hypothetical protein